MAQEFFELYLKPCLDQPSKFLDYRSEIEEEWRELKRVHILNILKGEEQEWMRRCIAVYRLLKK